MGASVRCKFCNEEFAPIRPNNTCCGAKVCKAKRQKLWRAKGSDPYYLGPTRQAVSDWVESLKASTPCTDCQNSFPAECMDFDHVTGTKIHGVATMVARSFSLEKVQAEIAKCELVCANCHRIRTRKRYLSSRK